MMSFGSPSWQGWVRNTSEAQRMVEHALDRDSR